MITSTIKRIFKAIFKGVYSVISFLNLQYTLLVLLVGLILFIAGVFDKNQSIYVIFWVFLGLSVLLSLSLNLKRLSPKNKKEKNLKQITEQPSVKQYSEIQTDNYEAQAHSDIVGGQISGQPIFAPSGVIEDKPLKYFRVKQNPNYVVGEFSNRYELYLKTQGGLKRIRIDYK